MAVKNNMQILSNQSVINTKLQDGVLGAQQARYSKQGLNYISNNTAIIPRDEAGNITLQENSINNPLLIIDSSTEQISTKSALRVLDTRFQYYSFPTEITSTVVDFALNVDVNLDNDNITTELKIPVPIDAQNQPISVVKINTSFPSTWYYGADSGITDSGYKQLQFTGGAQSVVNGYTITKDVIDTLQQTNQTLRFVINTQYVTNTTGEKTGIQLRLNRKNPKSYREFQEIVIYTEANTTGDAGASSNLLGFASNAYPVLRLEYFVDVNDIIADDTYYVEVYAGNNCWILPENCFWSIEPTEIPIGSAIFGYSVNNITKNAGVYDLNYDTILYNSSNKERIIAKRNLGTDQELVVTSEN